MAFSSKRFSTEARHSWDWYKDVQSESPVRPGDRMFLQCDGGPCISRLEIFPPRLEIEERGGLYVPLDDGPLDEWVYRFIASV